MIFIHVYYLAFVLATIDGEQQPQHLKSKKNEKGISNNIRSKPGRFPGKDVGRFCKQESDFC